MEPEPLRRMLAYPGFHHRGYRLHGAAYVDTALGVARRINRVGDFDPEAIAVRLADDAQAVNRAFALPRNHGDQRIGAAAPPKENDLDAFGHVLVDQHADMRSRLH